MFTAGQLVAHLVGDYVIQSHWMAIEKTKNSWAALVHAMTYTLPFLFITLDPAPLLWIAGTHFFIDRFRLARYVCWLKNQVGPKEYWVSWQDAQGTGYHPDVPQWLSVWLLFIADNIIHIIINGLALAYA